ncbi:MAG: PilN domain-containing protein [Burkholderiales bacterium]
MIKQHLDFAHPQPVVKLQGNTLGAMVLVASLAVCALIGWHYRTLALQIDATEARIEQLRKRSALAVTPRGSSREALIDEVRQVNQAAAQLTIAWDEMFREVEAATDRRVALLVLRPNVQKRELRISGEADDFGALRAYLERLDQGKVLENVRLVSHEIISRGNATPLRFEISAGWQVRT